MYSDCSEMKKTPAGQRRGFGIGASIASCGLARDAGIFPVPRGRLPTEVRDPSSRSYAERITAVTKRPNKRDRVPYSCEAFAEVKRRLALGHFQHDIAADLGWNQGRISEVNTGKLGGDPRQPLLL